MSRPAGYGPDGVDGFGEWLQRDDGRGGAERRGGFRAGLIGFRASAGKQCGGGREEKTSSGHSMNHGLPVEAGESASTRSSAVAIQAAARSPMYCANTSRAFR